MMKEKDEGVWYLSFEMREAIRRNPDIILMRTLFMGLCSLQGNQLNMLLLNTA